MPYIRPERRGQIKHHVQRMLNHIESCGDLNFAITLLIHGMLEDNLSLNYSNINSAIGVLDCAKMELYRQVAVPYEREKHKTNGPVSELDKHGE